MKKCITKLLIFVTLISCFGVIPSYANESDISPQTISTVDFDLGMSKGIQYFNNGQYYEARDEFQWFCDANWSKMNTGQQQYALDYLNSAKGKCENNEILGWWVEYEKEYGTSTQYYITEDGSLEVYYNERPVHWDGVYSIVGDKIEYSYTIIERTTNLISGYFIHKDGTLYNCGEGDNSPKKLIKIPKYMTADELKKLFVYNDNNISFDNVSDEINLIQKYLDDGLYLEAIDRCNYVENTFSLSHNDGITIIFMRDRANAWYNAYIENANKLSRIEFDNGMRKGIDYFNKGMYYEARDEFQWFCDANWGKMNDGQRKYALDYLDGAKREIQNLNTQDNGTWYHGGTYAVSGGIGYWQYSLSISNITSGSLTVNYFGMSQSSLEVKGARLYRQNDGSYAGSAITTDKENIYLKINIISNSHIKLTYSYGYYSEIIHFYK